MSKVYVIPDVHLKPRMLEKASELIAKGSYDAIVMLGDLVDDSCDLYTFAMRLAVSEVNKVSIIVAVGTAAPFASASGTHLLL